MENFTAKEGKIMAIVSYFTIIGLAISFFSNKNKANYFTSFHIRQSVGLHLLYYANKWIVYEYIASNVGWGFRILILGLFIFAIIGALQEEEKLVPVLGESFQEWFKNI
jgi:uncharacterized membrane protein